MEKVFDLCHHTQREIGLTTTCFEIDIKNRIKLDLREKKSINNQLEIDM